VVAEQVETGLEKGVVVHRRAEIADEIEQRRHQRLGHEAAAEATETAALVGRMREGFAAKLGGGREGVHQASFGALRTAAISVRILSRSFTPGADSTPLARSIPQGRTCRRSSPTFSGVKPPAISVGRAGR